MKARGFFCSNTSEPVKFTKHGFLTGPVMPTKWMTAIEIEKAGLVGIYTDTERTDHVALWNELTSLPVPDRKSQLFTLDYLVEQ